MLNKDSWCYLWFSKSERIPNFSRARRKTSGMLFTFELNFHRRIESGGITTVIITMFHRDAENLIIPVGYFSGTPNEFQARWSNFGRFSTASIPRPHARVSAAKLSAREICFRRSRSNGAEVACRGMLSENICPYSVQPNSQPVRSGNSWFSHSRYTRIVKSNRKNAK